MTPDDLKDTNLDSNEVEDNDSLLEDDLPPNCPPPDAEPANGTVFRCCKNNPPAASDMLTHVEREQALNADPCLRRALSVLRSEEDARHQARLFRGWKTKFVAKAELTRQHGWCLATPARLPSHTSWWPAKSLNPQARASLFTVTCEV